MFLCKMSHFARENAEQSYLFGKDKKINEDFNLVTLLDFFFPLLMPFVSFSGKTGNSWKMASTTGAAVRER